MTDSIRQRIARVIQAHPRAEKHHCGSPDCVGEPRYACWSYSLAEVIVEALQLTEETGTFETWKSPPDLVEVGQIGTMIGSGMYLKRRMVSPWIRDEEQT